jgi:hypothetical protein
LYLIAVDLSAGTPVWTRPRTKFSDRLCTSHPRSLWSSRIEDVAHADIRLRQRTHASRVAEAVVFVSAKADCCI